ncbi:MAG: hypothetical protein H6739_00995 [Alphaproteobacteria bacterium]|nr:hypothetical protein [Alphaproteobacteria bacterium]
MPHLTPLRVIGLGVALALAFVGFVHFGDNRAAVRWHHGFWLPWSASDIDFRTRADFIRLTDDLATTSFTLPRATFERMVLSMGCHQCPLDDFCGAPETEVHFPYHGDCPSPIADWLFIRGEVDPEEPARVRGRLRTDWT